MSLLYSSSILDSTCHARSELLFKKKMVKIKRKHENFLKITYVHRIQINYPIILCTNLCSGIYIYPELLL